MASLNDRLRKLEAHRQAQAISLSDERQTDFERHFRLIESCQAELEGEIPPHEIMPRAASPEVIAWLRSSPGWDTEEGRALLDYWQENVRS